MEIKEATELTLPRCIELGKKGHEEILCRKGFNFPYSLQRWLQMLREGRGAVFYVDIAGTPHGLICGFISEDLDTAEKQAHVHHWFTVGQGRGHGAWLLKAFEHWAEEKGCRKVFLGSAVECGDSLIVFSRLGYALDGTLYSKGI